MRWTGRASLGGAIPRRHVLLVLGLRANPLDAGLLAHVAAADLEKHGPPCICPHVILVQDGLPVGMVLPPAAVPEPEPGDDEPPRARGLLSRLFGRG
ncbi:MAG: hypothetical protein KIT31_29195 [Deltaproteobacteria bacterium]|nr:hypothetical protein [Deltaproteobacteria bacterium]